MEQVHAIHLELQTIDTHLGVLAKKITLEAEADAEIGVKSKALSKELFDLAHKISQLRQDD